MTEQYGVGVALAEAKTCEQYLVFGMEDRTVAESRVGRCRKNRRR